MVTESGGSMDVSLTEFLQHVRYCSLPPVFSIPAQPSHLLFSRSGICWYPWAPPRAAPEFPLLACLVDSFSSGKPSPGFTSSVKPSWLSLLSSPCVRVTQPCLSSASVLRSTSVDVLTTPQRVMRLWPPQWKASERGGKLWGEGVLWKRLAAWWQILPLALTTSSITSGKLQEQSGLDDLSVKWDDQW